MRPKKVVLETAVTPTALLADPSIKSFGMDILGPVSTMIHGYKVVVVMTDWSLKLRRAVPTTKTVASQVASLFLENWLNPYQVDKTAFTDNRAQMFSELVELACKFLSREHLTATGYHMQTNRQTDRFYKTIST